MCIICRFQLGLKENFKSVAKCIVIRSTFGLWWCMILAILAILGLVNRSDINFLNITRLNWGLRDQEMSAKRKHVMLSMAQKQDRNFCFVLIVTQDLHLTTCIAYKTSPQGMISMLRSCSLGYPNTQLSDPKPCPPLRSDNRESTLLFLSDSCQS